MATTGLRVSEMLSLGPEIIDEEPTVINLDGAAFSIITLKVMGKRRTPRQIIMFDGAMKYIKDYLEVRLPTGDKLFTGTRGNLTRRAVYDIVSTMVTVRASTKRKDTRIISGISSALF